MANKSSLIYKNGNYKRWYDLTVLILAHAFLLPLWIFLWTLIPLSIWLCDRGPVFFRQKRVGKDGQVFTILKFRSMVPDADLHGPAWTTKDDWRVTRIGKILRRTALDELPEILSIWKGDMSLVGPRALNVAEQKALELEIPGFAERLRVQPGLTGFAQIYDRTDNADDKFKYDVSYLQKMGPQLDTFLLMFSIWNTIAARWDQRGGKAAGDSENKPNIDPTTSPENQDVA